MLGTLSSTDITTGVEAKTKMAVEAPKAGAKSGDLAGLSALSVAPGLHIIIGFSMSAMAQLSDLITGQALHEVIEDEPEAPAVVIESNGEKQGEHQKQNQALFCIHV